MSKHDKRLPTSGTDSPRWKAQQVYMRMLTAQPHMRGAIRGHLNFGFIQPPGFIDDMAFYSDVGGTIYFNGVNMFVLLTTEASPLIGDELGVGQVGPQGEIII